MVHHGFRVKWMNTNMRVIQYTSGVIQPEIQACLDSVLAAYPRRELFEFPPSDVPLYESDKWRWQMMLDNDDCLYIDRDISLDAPLMFEQNGNPSMVYFKGQPDNCLMYSPVRRIFEAYEAERIRRGIAMETHGWFRKVLRDKSINEIKTGFTHLRASGYAELVRQYSQLRGGEEHGTDKH